MVSFRQVKKMTTSYPSPNEEEGRLRQIEGQVRGVQKMIQEGRYCVDVLQLLNSIQGAIEKVEDNILRRHLEGCVSHAVRSGSEKEREEKFSEILDLISKFRK